MWAISYRCHVQNSQGHGSGLHAVLIMDLQPVSRLNDMDLDGTAPMTRA